MEINKKYNDMNESKKEIKQQQQHQTYASQLYSIGGGQGVVDHSGSNYTRAVATKSETTVGASSAQKHTEGLTMRMTGIMTSPECSSIPNLSLLAAAAATSKILNTNSSRDGTVSDLNRSIPLLEEQLGNANNPNEVKAAEKGREIDSKKLSQTSRMSVDQADPSDSSRDSSDVESLAGSATDNTADEIESKSVQNSKKRRFTGTNTNTVVVKQNRTDTSLPLSSTEPVLGTIKKKRTRRDSIASESGLSSSSDSSVGSQPTPAGPLLALSGSYDSSRRMSNAGKAKLVSRLGGVVHIGVGENNKGKTNGGEKEAIKRESNRLNAARSRQRNKEKVEQLRKKVDELKTYAANVQHANQILLSQVEVLKQSYHGPLPAAFQLAQHLAPVLQSNGSSIVATPDHPSKQIFAATPNSNLGSLPVGSITMSQKHFLNDPTLLPLKQENEKEGLSQLIQSALNHQQAKTETTFLQSLLQSSSQNGPSLLQFNPNQTQQQMPAVATVNSSTNNSTTTSAAMDNISKQLALLQQQNQVVQQQPSHQTGLHPIANNLDTGLPVLTQPQQHQQISSSSAVASESDTTIVNSNSGSSVNPIVMWMALMGQNTKQQQQQEQQLQFQQQLMALQPYLQSNNQGTATSTRGIGTDSSSSSLTLANFQQLVDAAISNPTSVYKEMNAGNGPVSTSVETDNQSKRHSLPPLPARMSNSNSSNRRPAAYRRYSDATMPSSVNNSNSTAQSQQSQPVLAINKMNDSPNTLSRNAQQQLQANQIRNSNMQQRIKSLQSEVDNKQILQQNDSCSNNQSLEKSVASTSNNTTLEAAVGQQQDNAVTNGFNLAQHQQQLSQLIGSGTGTTDPRVLEILLHAISSTTSGSSSSSNNNSNSLLALLQQQQQQQQQNR